VNFNPENNTNEERIEQTIDLREQVKRIAERNKSKGL